MSTAVPSGQDHRPISTLVCLVLLLGLSSAVLAQQSAQPAAATGDAPSLQDQVNAFLQESGVPAIGAAVATLGEPARLAVAGHRTVERKVAVELDDLWHIGSITKSVTATLAAKLIEDATELDDGSSLQWTTPMGRLLPAALETPFADVELQLWFGHRTGMVANPAMQHFSKRGSERPVRELRLEVATDLLNTPPASEPDTEMLYSNAGYIVAGTAFEHLLDASWEEALRQKVLQPMGLESAGFGPPGTVDVVDQPRGHRGQKNAELKAVQPVPFADNPAFLGPAGTLHMNLADMTKYALAHLAGELGEDGFLSHESFQRLHRPLPGQQYGLGWIRFADDDGPAAALPGPLLMHNGSNTIWYAVIFIAPELRSVVVATVNAGLQNASAVNRFALRLLGQIEPAP